MHQLWEMMRKVLDELLDTHFIHASEAETSLELAIVPELVDIKKAKDQENLMKDKLFSAPTQAGSIFAFAATFFRPEHLELDYDVVDFPTKATAEKGEKILDVAVEKIVGLIEEIKRRYPPGVKPPVNK